MSNDLGTALRRAAPLLGLGVVALLVAIPAVEDLDGFLRGVGYVALVLGALVMLATLLRKPADADQGHARPGQ
jgi:hypothetical protein